MGEMIAAGRPTGGPPPQAAEMEQLGKRIAPVGATLNLPMIVVDRAHGVQARGIDF